MKELIEKIKNDKKLLIIILVGLAGAVMLVFSETASTASDDEIKETTTVSAICTITDIETMLEEKLVAIITQIKGAGKTSAVVTVNSSGEYVYAQNTKKESDDNSSSHDSEIVIYESQNGVDSGLVLCIRSPDILGVAVVCEGGESSVVKAEITKLITSLFGIGSDRVYVGSKSAY